MSSIMNKRKFNHGCIFELKFEDLPEDAPKSQRFQWVLIFKSQRYYLSFISYDFANKKRILHNEILGEVILDLKESTLVIGDDEYELQY